MTNQQGRRSKEDMFAIIEECQVSNLTKKEFCQQKGIPVSLFYYWQKKYKEQQNPGGFIPININARNHISDSLAIEIQYPNGVIVRLPDQTPPSIVKRYLQL